MVGGGVFLFKPPQYVINCLQRVREVFALSFHCIVEIEVLSEEHDLETPIWEESNIFSPSFCTQYLSQVSSYLCCLVFIVNLTQARIGLEEDPQLTNCLHHIGLWVCLWGIGPLCTAPSLGWGPVLSIKFSVSQGTR